jgi:hypothetical protein
MGRRFPQGVACDTRDPLMVADQNAQADAALPAKTLASRLDRPTA